MKLRRPISRRQRAAMCSGRVAPENGMYLIECLVYISVVFIVLGLAYALFNRALDYHLGLRRNTEDITAALHAGERWRADIRLATAPIVYSQSPDGPLARIRQSKGNVYYLYSDQSVWRFTSLHGQRQEVLNRVTDSVMRTEKREHVDCYRWKVELEPRRRRPGLTPQFFFLSVPQPQESQ